MEICENGYPKRCLKTFLRSFMVDYVSGNDTCASVSGSIIPRFLKQNQALLTSNVFMLVHDILKTLLWTFVTVTKPVQPVLSNDTKIAVY